MEELSGRAAIDMAQFHQVFFEEAAEHLANLENLLVTIDVGAPAAEDLNAIFRAAHSIKGGSGTFGFHEMAEVTHELESLLDRVRKDELELRSDMIDVLLAAADLLRAQLAHYRGETPAPEVAVGAMCERIRRCMAREAASAAAAAGPVTAPPPAASGTLRRLEIAFDPPQDAHSSLAGLAGELALVGTLESSGPPADGARCRWILVTAASDEEIRGRLAFVVDPAAVAIVPAGTPASAPAAVVADAAFGFFDDAPGSPVQDDGKGYGFFAPLPVPAPEVAPRAAPVAGNGSNGGNGGNGAAAPTAAVGAAKPAAAAESSIRVSVDKVDEMINLVGELVITQAMLTQTATGIDPVAHERLLAGLSQLERNTRDLQEAVMSVRMMPIAVVFNRFPRVVRDVAGKLDKEVELKTEGEGTELDKGLIEKIADPLTHLIRNSLDHGIESPAARLALGKPAKGTISLKAYHRGGSIVIEVGDDGAGLNREKILAKAKARGMPVSDTMADQEVWQLIFEAGLSTAEVVTDVSGRGVGMDVVRRNIRELGGRVEIESALGVGTRISVRLPLTLAILDGMSVGVSGETFIVPLNHVIESLQVAEREIHSVSGAGRVISVRGEYVPVVDLRQVFGLPARGRDAAGGVMVILESDGAATALFVDELLGQHQVVIKSLESNYRKVTGISGATIMGDGRVAMILDVPALVKMSRH
jgi:two-component system chemotaxis sensor kinase CheA